MPITAGQKVRALIRTVIAGYEQVDVILCPLTDRHSGIGESIDDPVQPVLRIYTITAKPRRNLTCIALPAGFCQRAALACRLLRPIFMRRAC